MDESEKKFGTTDMCGFTLSLNYYVAKSTARERKKKL